MFADLHMHSYCSDGTQSPQELVDEALDKGLSCISITDHDVFDAIAPAKEYSQDRLEIIPGIELSAKYNNRNVDILGYFIDYEKGPLVDKLISFQNARIERMKEMVIKLNELGCEGLTFEDIRNSTKATSLGRPHLAMVLVEKGYVQTKQQAFDKYLHDKGPAAMPKFKMEPKEAIDLIHAAGGLAVMAHPVVTKMDEIIPMLVESGIDGIEVYYANSSDAAISFYEGIAKKHNLLMTGGSDAHGKAKDNTWIAKKSIPYELVEKLKQATQS